MNRKAYDWNEEGEEGCWTPLQKSKCKTLVVWAKEDVRTKRSGWSGSTWGDMWDMKKVEEPEIFGLNF